MTQENVQKLVLTLCIIEQDGRVLLGMKKVRLGAGRWNGFGGKIEPGESIEAAAAREVEEEAGIIVAGLTKVGILEFTAPDRPKIEMHIFRAGSFTGTPVETDEMRPQWFDRYELPFREMWQSDLYWYPLFFRHELFTGEFTFDAHDRVISREVRVVATLDA